MRLLGTHPHNQQIIDFLFEIKLKINLKLKLKNKVVVVVEVEGDLPIRAPIQVDNEYRCASRHRVHPHA